MRRSAAKKARRFWRLQRQNRRGNRGDGLNKSKQTKTFINSGQHEVDASLEVDYHY